MTRWCRMSCKKRRPLSVDAQLDQPLGLRRRQPRQPFQRASGRLPRLDIQGTTARRDGTIAVRSSTRGSRVRPADPDAELALPAPCDPRRRGRPDRCGGRHVERERRRRYHYPKGKPLGRGGLGPGSRPPSRLSFGRYPRRRPGAVGAAREQVERCYLAGHPTLFPDDGARWVGQLSTSETLEATALRLAELDGVPAVLLPSPQAFAATVAGYVADFVEPAKVAALEDLDEGRQALGIATSWLRGKLECPTGTEAARR
jgi:hypothetical protein